MQGTAILSMLLLATAVHGAEPEDTIDRLKVVTRQMARQLMMQQLYTEERIRSGGDSGLKQIRGRQDGTKSYFVTHWSSSRSVFAIHDHSDLIRTLGMGEVIAVLNGVEFRTRHNDYKMRMPSTTSSDYHATEDIPFPEVPPEVTSKSTVDEQIVEMREWFKAWRDSNVTHRDYRPYFKPNLCYLEGAWTNDVNLDEPFDSDRHQLEAQSWFELIEQIRFTSYTGDKSAQENFAYLPTTIMSLFNDTPVFGQWNYRILCNPIKGDLPLSYIKPIDNLAVRLSSKETFDEYLKSRSARFQITPTDDDKRFTTSLLDDLMAQIPGKDNYGANITDSVFGRTKFQLGKEDTLNTGYYNRWYRLREEGAMGTKIVHRGFADRNLFTAETTQTRVAPITVELCQNRRNAKKRKCTTVSKRVSYAIPLEIVYMTPLHKWNPYNIVYKGEASSEEGMTVNADGRNGKRTLEKAFNGSNSKIYYQTPYFFYTGNEVDAGSADTAKGAVGILDSKGALRFVKSTGFRIQTPEIEGVGSMRIRYPIAPVHAEGSPIWKEVEALRDVVMDMQKYVQYFLNAPGGIAVNGTGQQDRTVRLTTALSTNPRVGEHKHEFELSGQEQDFLKKRNSNSVDVTTSHSNNHVHRLKVKWNSDSDSYVYVRCDDGNVGELCWDGHSRVLTQVSRK